MLNKTYNLIPAAASATLLAWPAAMLALNTHDSVCSGAGDVGASCGKSGAGNAALQSSLFSIINAVFFVGGVIAVLFVVIGGIKFVTSEGNSDKTKSARETILYALVGIAILLLARVIVGFVINSVSTS